MKRPTYAVCIQGIVLSVTSSVRRRAGISGVAKVEERDSKRLEEVREAARRGDIGELLKALDDPLAEVRIAATRAIGKTGTERARLALLGLLGDRWGQSPQVRIEALRSLECFYGAEKYADLLEQYISSDNRKLVSAARNMLEAADPKGYPARLLSKGCLDRSAISTYGRAELTEALPLIGSFLENRMDDGDAMATGYWGKVYSAVRALGNIGGEESVNTLSLLLEWIESRRAEGPLKLQRARKLIGATREAIGQARKG